MKTVLVLIAVLFQLCLTAFAASLGVVTVQSDRIVTSEDRISFEIIFGTPHSSAFLFQRTEIEVTKNEIIIRVFANAGGLTSPDTYLETVDVGMLAAGAYTYSVRLIGPDKKLEDTATGRSMAEHGIRS